MTAEFSQYMHRGGRQGRDRLAVLSRIVMPTTVQLFDRLGAMDGWHAIDVGCGGGDGSFELARRVGPHGSVHGLDLDKDQFSIVCAEAQERGLHNISLLEADVGQRWPLDSADIAYARFILTHLPHPLAALKHAFVALKPGGIVAIEDVDMGGHFCFPPSNAFDRYYEYYLRAAKLRGGDPFIGLRLDALLGEVGFIDVQTSLVQPFGRVGDVKIIAELTMRAMGDGLKSAGLATQTEVDKIADELSALGQRTDTLVFMPRIFQVWGRRPLT